MCGDPECKWITIIEDDKTGEKCYIHYKFNADMSFEELFSEGEQGLKIYAEILRDKKYILEKPRPTDIVMDFAGNLIVLDGTTGIMRIGEELDGKEELKSIVEDLDEIETLPNIPEIVIN
jgi:hypothetical protein